MWHPCVIHVSSLITGLCHRGIDFKQRRLRPGARVSSFQVVKYWRNFVKPHSSLRRCTKASSGIGTPHANPKKNSKQNKQRNFFKLFHSQYDKILPKTVTQLWKSLTRTKLLFHTGEITTKLESWMWLWADTINKIKQLLCRKNTKISIKMRFRCKWCRSGGWGPLLYIYWWGLGVGHCSWMTTDAKVAPWIYKRQCVLLNSTIKLMFLCQYFLWMSHTRIHFYQLKAWMQLKKRRKWNFYSCVPL